MRLTTLIQPAGKRERGFTLIELVIVLVVLSILAAIAIPIFLRQRIAANEGNAVASLRTLVTTEVAFRAQKLRDDDNSGDGDYGTLQELANPPGGGQPFIDSVLGNGVKAGYVFDAQVFPGSDTEEAGFAIRAIPSVYDRTGIRNFYVDEEGVIRFTTGAAEQGDLGPDSPPIN